MTYGAGIGPWHGQSEQKRADRHQAEAGAEGLDRADGGDAERVEAEAHGGDETQDPTDSGHAGAVPEPPVSETLLTGLIDILFGLTQCEPDAAVAQVRRMINQAPAILTEVQADLIRRLAADWTGTPDEFCRRYGYTRQRLHQMGVRWRG